MVLAVYNEEKNLPQKLRNLDALDYPKERLEVIIISDGSTDGTDAILTAWRGPNRRVVIMATHQGKSTALNHGIAEARGEIICFTDARQTIAPDGLKNLVEQFADPSVGCVSGELMMAAEPAGKPSDGVGLYWRLEKQIRSWEGLTGSTVGATGAFYAARKDALSPLPGGTILDDVYLPLQVVRNGLRVVFEPRARASDNLKPSLRQEFRRKLRTLTGNYQLLQLAPWVLTRRNPLRLRFICHKLFRLLVPFALLGALGSALWLRRGVYELALVLQLGFYALAVLSVLRVRFGVLSRLSAISLSFLVLNTAAALALVYFILGKTPVWAR
jgi:biofilm PGA synthesis N-glycosyltransferase PgaC